MGVSERARVADPLGRVAGDVWSTVAAGWPYLMLSILAAAAVPVYLGTDRLGGWLSRRRWVDGRARMRPTDCPHGLADIMAAGRPRRSGLA
jgi:hypothetical protein